MSILCSMADAISSGSCPILFKVLTLNVAICIVCLPFSNYLMTYCFDTATLYITRTQKRWTKGCILLFPRRSDLRIVKNYGGITLTSIAAKAYNALLLNHNKPEIEKIIRKNQNGFLRNWSTSSQILTIH